MELKELGIAVLGVDDRMGGLRETIERAGNWSVVGYQWPELPPEDALVRVSVIVLATTGDSPPEDLIRFLRGRSRTTSLVVIGPQPARIAMPTLWLPAAPPPAVLAGILAQLVTAETGAPASPWRRKADMLIGNSELPTELLLFYLALGSFAIFFIANVVVLRIWVDRMGNAIPMAAMLGFYAVIAICRLL